MSTDLLKIIETGQDLLTSPLAQGTGFVKLTQALIKGLGVDPGPYLNEVLFGEKLREAKYKEAINTNEAEVHKKLLNYGIDNLINNSKSNINSSELTTLLHKLKQNKANRDSALYSAINCLVENKEPVSEKSIDDNFITHYFKYVEDVSTEDLQKLWGRILAGEIIKPSSYSIRTLEFIKNLTQREADIINRVSKQAIKCQQFTFILDSRNSTNTFNQEYFDDKIFLKSVGILNSETSILRQHTNQKNKIHYIQGGKLITFQIGHNDSFKNLEFNFFVNHFTPLGKEILTLISEEYNEKFIDDIAEVYLKKEPAISCTVSNILNSSIDSVTIERSSTQEHIWYPIEDNKFGKMTTWVENGGYIDLL